MKKISPETKSEGDIFFLSVVIDPRLKDGFITRPHISLCINYQADRIKTFIIQIIICLPVLIYNLLIEYFKKSFE